MFFICPNINEMEEFYKYLTSKPIFQNILFSQNRKLKNKNKTHRNHQEESQINFIEYF
jgi:hypothetical protein